MAGSSQPGVSLSAESLVLAGAVAVGASAVAVWIGAQVAALLFGGHCLLPVGLHDAGLALPGLVAHPSRPREAWPSAVAARLPGPVGYWVATVPPLGVAVAAVAVLLAVANRRVGVARRRRMGLNPEARFARLMDLAPLLVAGPTPGRLILGRTRAAGRHRLVATEDASRPLDAAVPRPLRRAARRRRSDRGAVLALGPTRCGKTAALAVPAILEWAGPLIAVSVKTDLLGATETRRRAVGEVRVFDPAGATGRNSAGWSPLTMSGRLAGARRAARSVAASTDWNASGSGDMSFWASAGEDLVSLLFWLAAQSGLGMDSVVTWITTQDKDTVLSLARAYAHHLDPAVAADGGQVHDALQAVWRSDARQLTSLYLVARQMIRPWQEPTVQRSAVTNRAAPVDLDWLLGTTSTVPGPLVVTAGGRADRHGAAPIGALPPAGLWDGGADFGEPEPKWGSEGREALVTAAPVPARANSLYLCADLDDAERLAPVLGGLVDELLRDVYARVGRTGKPLDPPLLLVIDEAGNWPMRSLPSRISTCAGMGVVLLLLYQSKAQIDAAYGPKADIVVSNAPTKVFFSGLSDRSSLDYAGSLLGQEHVAARSVSADTSPAGGRSGVSDAPTRLELLPTALLRQIPPGEALLIHRTLPPVHLRGRYWFRDPHLRRLATGSTANVGLDANERAHRCRDLSAWLLARVRRVRGGASAPREAEPAAGRSAERPARRGRRSAGDPR
ncbi:type IV secretory system conjugative DNA transfer family protein [Frankia sp. AgB1.9]|uniref:type IV secretory system conjugative DNA transfer family protein n=1 Tax=unclassified Frankia TaxID=2632575 RepID=UPI001933D071|nr:MULTISPECIES: type IV secretory system conjugative DNA transfer family protein [unclassified Frankia]MBL7487891.1 type IV secretory system conjugative DNA transfer family protein [Frankia sp. AgW1.1]MBL7549956.1 type IV secretory system conjugative DNA transfer family protein [Frankia sp. AgB1.9]MBL7621465.1 type IV secretory system conjugative DNA transfer family protein [Frankia sp. AgB1.8]